MNDTPDRTPKTVNKITRKHIIIAGSIITVLVVLVIFIIDERNFARNSLIEITGAPQGTLVLLDNKQVARFTHPSDLIALDKLSIGMHTLVLVKDGHWPWTKDILLANNEKTRVSAFLLPQEPAAEIIPKNHERYDRLSSVIAEHTIPTSDKPFSSNDERVSVWIENNTVVAKWNTGDETKDPPAAFCITGECREKLTVLPADQLIRDIAFLPQRHDVIVFSAENGIFALELDKRGTQNFQPIYLGIAPEFIFLEDGLLALEDRGQIMVLRLF